MVTVDGIFIPPSNIRVRMVGTLARSVLYLNPRNNSTLQSVSLGSTTYDDQYFYVFPGTGQYAGKYRIKSAFTGEGIYMNRGTVGSYAWAETGLADQYFRFAAGTGDKTGTFRIICDETGLVLFTRTTSPNTGVVSTKTADLADQYVSFWPEDMVFDSLTYDLKGNKIYDTAPFFLAEAIGTNKTATDQEDHISLSSDIETESSFEHELGLKLGTTAEGKAGVPFVAEGKVSVTVETSYNFRWGTTTREKKAWSKDLVLKVAPGKKYKAYATANMSKIDVPFVATFKSAKDGTTMQVNGMYKGLCVYAFETQWDYVT